MTHRSNIYIIGFVFVPFMGAYLLSELFRNINSTIGPLLQQEFALDAATLDLMTSLFLFAVAGSQIFTGILLDRLGARRTVAMLLIIASIGGPAVCRRNFYNFACGTIADWYWHVRRLDSRVQGECRLVAQRSARPCQWGYHRACGTGKSGCHFAHKTAAGCHALERSFCLVGGADGRDGGDPFHAGSRKSRKDQHRISRQIQSVNRIAGFRVDHEKPGDHRLCTSVDHTPGRMAILSGIVDRHLVT